MAKQLSSFQPRSSTKLYMPLNGSSIDISGNGNHGTDTNISYVGGKFGQGARFIRANSSIISYTTNSLNLGSNSFTVSYWVNFASASTFASFAVVVGTRVSANNSFYSGLQGNEIGGAFNGGVTVTGGLPVFNRWYYLTFVVKTSGIELYIDGQYKSVSASSSYNIIGSDANILGCYTNYDSQWAFDGLLDEVIIENRAWTATEISAYYRKSMINYKKKSLFNLIKDFIISLETGTFAITGYNATITLIQRIVLETGNFIITGYDAVIKTSGVWLNQAKSATATMKSTAKSVSTWINRGKNQ